MKERTEVKLQADPSEYDKFITHIKHLHVCGIDVRTIDHRDVQLVDGEWVRGDILQHFAYYEVDLTL